jgi:hypothetical protein
MNRYALIVLFVVFPNVALAQDFKGYRTTTLDAVVNEWDAITKDEGAGISFSRPQKIKFFAVKTAEPVACSNAPLEIVLKMMNFADLLNQVSVNHCIFLGSNGKRSFAAYVQDVLVPGLNSDVKMGRPMVIYADVLAYQVAADRSRNAPIMLINRFEPK